MSKRAGNHPDISNVHKNMRYVYHASINIQILTILNGAPAAFSSPGFPASLSGIFPKQNGKRSFFREK